jgi:hypothetical protein
MAGSGTFVVIFTLIRPIDQFLTPNFVEAFYPKGIVDVVSGDIGGSTEISG